MEELKEMIEKLADKELERAMKKYPLFNSSYEGYAIILKKVQEAELEIEAIKISLNHAWTCIKENNPVRTLGNIDDLKVYAINGAAELIQVAAMAQKYMNSFGEGIEIHE